MKDSTKVVHRESSLAASVIGLGIVMPFTIICTLEETIEASVVKPVVCSVGGMGPCGGL